MTKLVKDENAIMDVIVKICNALNCTMDEIVEVLPDEEIMK